MGETGREVQGEGDQKGALKHVERDQRGEEVMGGKQHRLCHS